MRITRLNEHRLTSQILINEYRDFQNDVQLPGVQGHHGTIKQCSNKMGWASDRALCGSFGLEFAQGDVLIKHFVGSISVTNQTGQSNLCSRIQSRQLAVFEHVRPHSEDAPAHDIDTAFSLAVNARSRRQHPQ